jgi:uncharacterized protein YggE
MMRTALLVSMVMFGVAGSVGAQVTSVASGPIVVTQGEAVIKRAPDRAWLNVATETRDAQPERARSLGAEAMTALQEALKGAGLADDAIRTTGYSLVPEMDYRNGKGVVRGYLVRNQIEVRIDDLDRLSSVIDAVTTSRATSVSVTGPRFGLKDEAAAQAEALRQAVTAGLARARAIAMGAGRTLGTVTRIEDMNAGGGAPAPPLMRMAAAAEAAPTPITPGEIEIRAHVTLTAELR